LSESPQIKFRDKLSPKPASKKCAHLAYINLGRGQTRYAAAAFALAALAARAFARFAASLALAASDNLRLLFAGFRFAV
jgi:hypothetical protein